VETQSERVMMAIVDQAARRRDKAAGWSDVVRRFAPYVHAVLVDAYGLPERHAREVFHEVFLRTWERMDELRDADAVRARVRTVTCELAKEAQDELAGEVDPPVAARLRELDNALAVREAIRSLAPVQREVATLCWIEGCDHATIATALGLSVETVAAHVIRARRRLGQVLQQEASDTTPPTPAC
jgi:RNA polymerase sigma factor (sigma-70 family)